MKRLVIIVAVILFSNKVFSQSRYWVGVSGGLWSSMSNWSATSGGLPGASSPITSNDIVFDNGFTGIVEMDVLLSPTPFIINSLLVTANSTVTLQRTQTTGGVRILQLASTNVVSKGLQIDNGSTLVIDATNTGGTLDYTLSLTGGAGVTGEISGNLYIKATGSGTGGTELDLQDDATHFAALVVKNSGVIKYFDDTDNTSPSTGSYLTMEPGSTYEIAKNGGSLPSGTWDDNSNIIISGTTSSGITFNQSTYGNLEWNASGMTGATQMITTLSPPITNISLHNFKITNTNGKELRLKTGTSAPPAYEYTIRGNLEISNLGILAIAGVSVTTSGAGARLFVGGNIINNGILKSEGASGTVNDFELNGTSNQNIANSGTFSGTNLKFIMNGAGATLQSPLTLPGNLSLQNGKLKTNNINVLTMIDGTSWSGGSSISFIEGPMIKRGDDDFTFPIGKGGIFARIRFHSVAATPSDEFKAEYIRSNPQSTFGYNYEVVAPPENFDHISYVEYWKLQKTLGTPSPLDVTLWITEYSFCTDVSTTFVTRYDQGADMWKQCGVANKTASAPVPPSIYSTGFIQSLTAPEEGVFTLYTSQAFPINPLPIKLISFDAKKINTQSSSLNWELAACCSKDARFEIQKAGDDQCFKTIATVTGNETNRFYSFTDNSLKSGINYYRLKMTDIDGSIVYSRIAAVLNGIKGLFITMSPTIITNNAVISFASSSAQKLDLFITDMSGRTVKRMQQQIPVGNSNIDLAFNELRAGIYQLLFVSSEGEKQALRFIKQ